MVALTVVVVLFLCALMLGVRYPGTALYAVIFLTPWQGLDPDIGLRVVAYQVVLVGLVAPNIGRILQRQFGQKPRVPGSLAPFVYYSVVITLFSLPFLPVVEVAGGTLRSQYLRPIFQIAIFALHASLIVMVPMLITNLEGLVRAARVYVLSCTILAAIGWYQIAVWYGTGTNPLPIGFMDHLLGGSESIVREGAYEFLDLYIRRMNALGGEPKNLGAGLVIALLVLQVGWLYRLLQIDIFSAVLWFFLAASAVMTFSTTAIYMWVIGSVVVILSPVFSRGQSRLKAWSRLAIAGFVLVAGVAAISAGSWSEKGSPSQTESLVSSLLIERTIERGVLEDFDEAIIEYLGEHPLRAVLGHGLGNIHLFADSYLADDVAEYAGGGVFVGKAQYLRFISEIGVLGLALFCWPILRKCVVFWGGRRSLEARTSELYGSVVAMMLSILMLYLANGAIMPQAYVMIGVFIAAAEILLAGQHNVVRRMVAARV